MFRHRLINGQRQHQLVVVLAHFNLIGQPGIFPEKALVEHIRVDIVETEAHLLVVRIAVEIVLFQVICLFDPVGHLIIIHAFNV